jgi:hypothetical protein
MVLTQSWLDQARSTAKLFLYGRGEAVARTSHTDLADMLMTAIDEIDRLNRQSKAEQKRRLP